MTDTITGAFSVGQTVTASSPLFAPPSFSRWRGAGEQPNLIVNGRGPVRFTFNVNQRQIHIYEDGRVEFEGDLDQAAKDFWDAVSRIGTTMHFGKITKPY